MIEMFVTGVALDVRSNIPLVILNDDEQKYTLPIWIGHAEAQAIARGLECVETERPMTHDLMVDLLDSLDAEVDSIEINSFENSTFFASIILNDAEENTLSIDSRPSDAIALALRVEAPIFVSESILKNAPENMIDDFDEKQPEVSADEEISDNETEFKEFLKGVKASDFTLNKDK